MRPDGRILFLAVLAAALSGCFSISGNGRLPGADLQAYSTEALFETDLSITDFHRK